MSTAAATTSALVPAAAIAAAVVALAPEVVAGLLALAYLRRARRGT